MEGKHEGKTPFERPNPGWEAKRLNEYGGSVFRFFHAIFYSSLIYIYKVIDKHKHMHLTFNRTDSATHCTTRVTTYTCYMYCCHNTGIDRRDFKFSVF